MAARRAGTGLEAAFAAEELAGMRLAARTRAVILAVVAVWITVENPFPRFLFLYGIIAAFVVLGFVPLWLREAGVGGRWARYAFPLLDYLLLAVAVFAPFPYEQQALPPQMLLRFGNEIYLFPLVASIVLSYSPALVLWSGVCAAAVWAAVTVWIWLLPDSVTTLRGSQWLALTDEQLVRALLDPHRVNVGLLGRQVVLLLLTSAALAVFVRRARQLVGRQAAAERERANLSRYFSPNLVDELAQTDEPLGPTRQQTVAVLFADIVGFTSLAESLAPGAVIAMLREFHGRMERVVFDHGGTVDKYIGDAIMATFGTPRVGPADAANAVRATRAMCDAIAAWNAARAAAGLAAIRVGVGVHYGPVVLGDIGGEARLEFAVIGDTVNVAQRLERLTRALDAEVVASDALIEAARREAPEEIQALLAGFTRGPEQTLRGREAAMAVWVWRASPTST